MDKCFSCGKFNLPLSNKTYIMGILNITPDSFSDGGKYLSNDLAIMHAAEMVNEGVDIIDIGGQSTRPGCSVISWQDEWDRIADTVKWIVDNFPQIPVSIDTFYPQVMQRALDIGAVIINDVTGCQNEKMFELAAQYNAGLVIMHPGNPDMVSGEVQYDGGVVNAVSHYFDKMIAKAQQYGINNSRLCLDPGIGFGKTYDENFALIKATSQLKRDDIAYLVGASRKRITAPAGVPFSDRLAGTLAIHTAAQLYGADILRVHDVAEAVQAATAADKIIRSI